jgi:transcriptional adapter 3
LLTIYKGDREKPFVIPKRGQRTYKEVWAEEDGVTAMDLGTDRLPENEPRGDIDQMNDDIAETDELSVGPVDARILSCLRPESRRPNEDIVANGFDMDIDGDTSHVDSSRPPEPPATQFPEANWKNVPAIPRQEYAQLDERILGELKYLAFMAPTETADFTSGMDDEVAARLRYLQGELRRQSIINGARKAALLDVTEAWMAKQEYTTIADDLDNQLNQAYLKRNRNIGKKGKQVKRPGGAGGGSHVVGVARPGAASSSSNHPGVGEPIRSLMERKKKWNEWIGPVVEYGKTSIPKETIFPKDVIDKHAAKEQENWGEEQEI